MADQQIVDYLKANTGQYPVDTLRQTLIQSGYSPTLVDEAIRHLGLHKSKTTPPRGMFTPPGTTPTPIPSMAPTPVPQDGRAPPRAGDSASGGGVLRVGKLEIPRKTVLLGGAGAVLACALAVGAFLATRKPPPPPKPPPISEVLDDAMKAFDRRDYSSAHELWLEAARSGNAEAQYNLGSLYATGKGVDKNLQEAYKWYSMAAVAGDEAARKRVAQMRPIILKEIGRSRGSGRRIELEAFPGDFFNAPFESVMPKGFSLVARGRVKKGLFAGYERHVFGKPEDPNPEIASMKLFVTAAGGRVYAAERIEMIDARKPWKPIERLSSAGDIRFLAMIIGNDGRHIVGYEFLNDERVSKEEKVATLTRLSSISKDQLLTGKKAVTWLGPATVALWADRGLLHILYVPRSTWPLLEAQVARR